MVKIGSSITLLLLITFSCKKANERACFKSTGANSQWEMPLDSVREFRLYKNITYHVYQDTLRKLVVRGGKNVIDFVKTDYADYTLSVRNENKCHFLRDYNNRITVEIHYPFLYRFYSETNDSLVFHDTIFATQLHVEQVMGGGGVRAHVKTTHLVMIASHGVGGFVVSGDTQYADLRIQTGASGNAINLTTPLLDVDQNSSGNLYVNMESTNAYVWMRGTGNVIYTGTPDSLEILQEGDGTVIPQ